MTDDTTATGTDLTDLNAGIRSVNDLLTEARSNVSERRYRFPIPAYGDELTADIAAASDDLADAERELSRAQREQDANDGHTPGLRATQASPVQVAQDAADAAQQRLDALHKQAARQVLTVIFKRLSPDAYQRLLDRHSPDGRFNAVTFAPALMSACLLHIEGPNGDTAPLELADLTGDGGLLSPGQNEAAFSGLVAFHRETADLPFLRKR